MCASSTDVHDGGGGLVLARALALDLGLDGLADGQLARALADLRQVRAAEPLRHLDECNNVTYINNKICINLK